MPGKFGIQINPELILKLTEPEKYERQKSLDLFKRTPRPIARPEPEKPSQTLELPQPLYPLPTPPSLETLAPANKPRHGQHHPEEDDAALAPYLKVAAECEHAVESLRKQEDKERELLHRRAKELQSKQYHPPEPKPFPCPDEQKACISCLTENRDDPLKCQDVIKAYSLCAEQVRQRFVAAGFGRSQAKT